MNRPKIPMEIQRQVKVEAGHRCAIPACKQHPIALAHIVPWAKCHKHEFHNLIALCDNCHRRYDDGDIDRKAMKMYKNDLGQRHQQDKKVEKEIIDLKDKVELLQQRGVENCDDAIKISPVIKEEKLNSIDLPESAGKIIDMVNQIYAYNDKEFYFDRPLESYLKHRRSKSYFSAAKKLALIMDDLEAKDFFGAFQEVKDQMRAYDLECLRKKIIHCYDNEIQAMKVEDKDSTLAERYITKHDRENGKTDLPIEHMESILDDFYKYLIQLSEFPIKP